VRSEDYIRNIRPNGTASYEELNTEPPPLSSRRSGWEGIVVECELFEPFDNGEVVYDENFIALFNTNNAYMKNSFDGVHCETYYHAGDLILGPAEQPVRWSLLDDPCEALVVTVRPEVIRWAAQEMSGADSSKIHIIGQPKLEDPLIRQILLTLRAELEARGVGERLYVESLRNMLAVHLLRHYSTLSRRPDRWRGLGLPAPKLRRAIEAVEDHLVSGISLAELAEATGVSVSHFEVLFKRSTGVSPHQYLLRCRVGRAKELLRFGDLSLADVAARVGFCDQSHFTRHFKRIVGVTPSVYREES
jgi:AraC family transcriptional regulator